MDSLICRASSKSCRVSWLPSVLFTANDAYMRDYHLVVPADCVASESLGENRQALRIMRTLLKADVTLSTRLRLDRLAARAPGKS